MKLSTSNIKQTLTVAGLTILLAAGLNAQTKLGLERTSANVVSVKLENLVAVAGMQFTVNASSNLTLNSIETSGRTEGGNWQIHQNQVNDSTINVVIINAGLANIPTGQGAIAQFSFKDNGSAASSYVNFTRVVVADQYAKKVEVEISNVEWSVSVAQAEEKEFTLEQNYPNPFNPSTTIRYTLEQPGQVNLKIYDITGRVVMTVVDEFHFAGSYNATWTGRDETGSQVASGVYFAQLNMNGMIQTMKMNLLK